MALTTLQIVALAALPLSFISITMGSVTHQNLPKELRNEFGFVAKLKTLPFFLAVCTAKVWIVADAMWALTQVHPLLAPLPLLALFAIQTGLHLKYGVSWRETFYSALGNLPSLRRPEGQGQEQCQRLLRWEAFVSALANFGLVAISTTIRFTGTWTEQNLAEFAAPFISMGMLAVYLAVSISYIWVAGLNRTLFLDKDTRQTYGPTESQSPESIELQPLGASAPESTTNPGRNVVSSKWLAPAVVVSLIFQLGIFGYLGHPSGKQYLIT